MKTLSIIGVFLTVLSLMFIAGYENRQDDMRHLAAGNWQAKTSYYDYNKFVEGEENGK